MTPPTPEDLARSADADLAACDAATPGPWRADHFCTEHYEGVYLGTAGTPDDPTDNECIASFESDDCERLGDDVRPVAIADLTFCALARTALPAWIRRAAHVEAELARLRAALREIARDSDEADTRGRACAALEGGEQ